MRRVLQPLKEAGVHGIEMICGNGVARRVHPIFAVFVGDYPEQILVACCKSGQCPKCTAPADELGEPDGDTYPLRDLCAILDALDLADGDPTAFAHACNEAGIKPVFHPFWEDLPYTNIYRSITPDILHQICQGVIKHLLAWVKTSEAFGTEEIDARCRRMPPNHHLRYFSKGITSLSRVSGSEHRHMCQILLGLVVDLPLPGGRSPARLVRAVRALLDFMYLARYRVHSTESLVLLDEALNSFHDNKSIFIDLGIRADFNFPKLHSLLHYSSSIKLFGSTDNYDTEYSERLHIDFAKDAYRASNRRDEYPQMTLWLSRKEKVQSFEKFVKWRKAGGKFDRRPQVQLAQPAVTIRMAVRPARTRGIYELAGQHNAPDFRFALTQFLVRQRHPNISSVPAVNRLAGELALPFHRVALFYKVKFQTPDLLRGGSTICDTVHVRPGTATTPARFDTALLRVDRREGQPELQGK